MALGFVVRLACTADYPLVARLFPELAVEDPVPTPAQFESRMLPRVIVAEGECGIPVGYAFWRVYGKTTHIVNVIVDGAARGRGVGHALLDDVRTRVVREGSTRWYLNVKQDNAVAIRVYERDGFSIEHEAWALKTEWSRLMTLPVAAPDAEAFVPVPDEDGALAEGVGFDEERITLLRAAAGVAIAGVREHGRYLGLAAFDPFYPGIYPIRVARPALARPLLDALRRHAKEDRVMVFVEGDPALQDLLMGVGAKLGHALYQMGGSL
jgi:GNAT superfamily N-acetyltransferase